jgi:hypothetical protein
MLKEHHDLCCICVNDAVCVDRGTAKRPKLHCESFDLGVQSSGLREQDVSSVVAAPVGGLCCNCRNRGRCTIQTPEGDIWHCEEYC